MGKTDLFSDKILKELLHKYAPVLLLNKDEKFLPVPVECFFQVAEVTKDNEEHKIEREIRSQFVNTKQSDTLVIKPKLLTAGSGRNDHKEFLLKQQESWLKLQENQVSIYGYYVQNIDGEFLYITLTYYFFYLGNIITASRNYYSHDCDWEMIRIFFKEPIPKIGPKKTENEFSENRTPYSILFQQHDHDSKSMDLAIKWKSMINNGAVYNTHPAILVGNGTHASAPPFNFKKSNIDEQFKDVIEQSSLVSKFTRFFTKNFIKEYYNSQTDLPFHPLTPPCFPETHVLSRKTPYNLLLLNETETTDKIKRSRFWLNFQGKWGNQWRFVSSSGIRGPKFFSGFGRTFNFTKSPSSQIKDPAYWLIVGIINQKNFKIDEAKNNYFNALDLLKKGEGKGKVQDKIILAKIKHNLGTLEQDLGNLVEAKLHFRASLTIFQALSDKARQANSLHNLGVLAQKEGRMLDARSKYEASLAIDKELDNKAGEARSLHQLGMLAQTEGRRQNARNIYSANLATFQKLGDKVGEASSLHQLGVLEQSEGRMQVAKSNYKASLAIFQKLGDKAGEASSLLELGILEQVEGCIQDAWNNCKASLIINSSLGKKVGEARSLHQLSVLAQAKGQIHDARSNYEANLIINQELNDKAGEAKTLGQLGIVAQAQGRMYDGRRNYEASLAIMRELGDKFGEASSLHNLGALAQAEGRIQDARCNYEASLAIKLELGDKAGKASSLHNLGTLAQAQGRMHDARYNYGISLAISRELGDKAGEASCLHSLSIFAQSEGRMQDAWSKCKTSLMIFQELGGKAGEANAFLQLGILAHINGRMQDAKSKYEVSLKIFQDVGDKVGEGNSLHQLGMLEQFEGRMQDARIKYEISLKIFQDVGDKVREGNSLHQLGMLEQFEGRMQNARIKYEISLRIFQDVGDKVREGNSLHQLGMLEQFEGRMQNARIKYEISLRIFQKLGDKAREADTLGQIGLLYFKNDQKKALEYFHQCLRLLGELKTLQKMVIILRHISSSYYILENFEKVSFYFKKMLIIVDQSGRNIKKTKTMLQLILKLEENMRGNNLNKICSIALEYSRENKDKLSVAIFLGKLSIITNGKKSEDFFKKCLKSFRNLEDRGQILKSLVTIIKFSKKSGNLKLATRFFEIAKSYTV